MMAKLPDYFEAMYEDRGDEAAYAVLRGFLKRWKTDADLVTEPSDEALAEVNDDEADEEVPEPSKDEADYEAKMNEYTKYRKMLKQRKEVSV